MSKIRLTIARKDHSELCKEINAIIKNAEEDPESLAEYGGDIGMRVAGTVLYQLGVDVRPDDPPGESVKTSRPW